MNYKQSKQKIYRRNKSIIDICRLKSVWVFASIFMRGSFITVKVARKMTSSSQTSVTTSTSWGRKRRRHWKKSCWGILREKGKERKMMSNREENNLLFTGKRMQRVRDHRRNTWSWFRRRRVIANAHKYFLAGVTVNAVLMTADGTHSKGSTGNKKDINYIYFQS